MKYVYIHGATASQRSFAYIQKCLRAKDCIYLNYEKDRPAEDNLIDMIDTLSNEDGPFFYISHSLGGIYATYLQKEFFDVSKGSVSLSTPFNGSEIATWGSVLNPHYTLFKDITPYSDFISKSRTTEIKIPWLQIVSVSGEVPWLSGKNDGICTMNSMTYRKDVEYEYVERNHYEIVLSKRVVELIKKFVKSIQTT